ncbi:MAG: hypothetical protein AAAB35_11740 [Phyllobacterium sp.]|uniref:hypothetical protein n=1 Tax=Phyllobacterium sp. TaxID=1871046 RepID=UPI0030F1F932
MLVKLTDDKGKSRSVDSDMVVQLRDSEFADEPQNTVLVDYAAGGLFAQGTLDSVSNQFAPFIPLATLHQSGGNRIKLNAKSIKGVIENNIGSYKGNSLAVVDADHRNTNVPSRNWIPLRETVEEATEIIRGAKGSFQSLLRIAGTSRKKAGGSRIKADA